jgi:hypothetical protein
MPKKVALKEMEGPGGGAVATPAANPASMSKGSMIAVGLVVVTFASFYQVKYMSAPGQSTGVERDGNYLKGLAIACLALVGNAMVGAFRKMLSQHDVGSASQVGLAALIQGVAAIGYCFNSGDLKFGTSKEMQEALPPKAFWYSALREGERERESKRDRDKRGGQRYIAMRIMREDSDW